MKLLVSRRTHRASSRRSLLPYILSDRALREELFVDVIIATQAREGITTTREQAIKAYRKVRYEIDQARQGL